MVGDWIYVLAGVATVLVDRDGKAAAHRATADHAVDSLRELVGSR